jgi:uncharacterized membrane protein (UPF0127 family)
MKNTRIPLDVVWIGDNHLVVHTASLPACRPEGFEEVVPPVESRYVLEIPAGEIASHGFSIGDFITLS